MSFLKLCSVVLLTVCPPLVYATASDAIPHDFKVVAHFGSGSIDPGDSAAAWDYTLRADGKATLKVFRFPGDVSHTKSSSFLVPQNELARMVGVIEHEDFFSLPKDMLGGATDSASYDLDITAGGKQRKVRVYAPFDVHDKKSLRRFRRVWEAVFRPIPQPDEGDAIHHLRVNS